MNKIALMLVGLSLVACAPKTQVVYYPIPEKAPESKNAIACAPNEKPVDNFDKAGQVMADGSRWVYHKAEDAYDKLTSEEYKKMYSEWYESAKRRLQDNSPSKKE